MMEYKYETKGGLPSHGETYAKLHESLIKAQESAYMLAHLTRAQGGSKDNSLADGWIAIGEMMKRLIYQVTELAKARLS